MIVVYLSFILWTKSIWNVNKESISNITAGQEIAITYILKAKAFKDAVLKARTYSQEDAEVMENLTTVLEKEFNRLSAKQPIIMDSMLETMENLKQMKKNYESEPDIYSFDYKKELDHTVKDRPKVYVHQKM